MKSNREYPWDAARAASRRPLRTYKPCGPVGEKMLQHPLLGMQLHTTDGSPHVYDIRACDDCGHQICSCVKESSPEPFKRTQLLGHLDTATPAPKPVERPVSSAGHWCSRCKVGKFERCFYKQQNLRSCQQINGPAPEPERAPFADLADELRRTFGAPMGAPPESIVKTWRDEKHVPQITYCDVGGSTTRLHEVARRHSIVVIRSSKVRPNHIVLWTGQMLIGWELHPMLVHASGVPA